MTSDQLSILSINRRRLLALSAAGVSALSLGTVGGTRSARAADTVRWVSPRGTIEVLDDYPYWVGKKYGYFGDHRNDAGTRAVGRHRDGEAGRPEPGGYGLSVAGRVLPGAGAGHSAGVGLPHGWQPTSSTSRSARVKPRRT